MVEEYVNASTMQHRDAFDFVEEFAKEMSEMKGKCIDIGCGPGDVTKELILPKLSPNAELVGKRTRVERTIGATIQTSFVNVCRSGHIAGDDRSRETEVPERETFVVYTTGHRDFGFTQRRTGTL